jgi:hypothetical protein
LTCPCFCALVTFLMFPLVRRQGPLTHTVQKSIVPLLVIALLLFGPKRTLPGSPIESLDVQSVISILIIGCAMIDFGSKRRPVSALFSKPFGLVFLALMTLLFWTLIVTILNGSVDTFYPLRTGRATLTFVACTVVTRWWSDVGFSADALLKALFWFLVIQAIVIIGEMLFPEVREFIYDYWSGYEAPGPEWLRVPGLIIGLAYTSVIQLIGLIIGMLYVPNTRGIERLLTVLALSLVGVSLIFTGRTGLVLGIILVPLLLLRGKLRGVIIGTVVVGLMVFIGDAVFSNLNETESLIIKDWAFEWLPGTDQVGSSTDSTEILSEMWFTPNTEFGWLVGSSRSYHQKNSDDPMLVASDIGYVAFLHGIGIPGLLLSGLIYVILLVFGWQRRRTSPIHSWCVIAAVVIFSIGNAKEVMFLTRWGWELTVLLVGALVLKEKENVQPVQLLARSDLPSTLSAEPPLNPMLMRDSRPD